MVTVLMCGGPVSGARMDVLAGEKYLAIQEVLPLPPVEPDDVMSETETARTIVHTYVVEQVTLFGARLYVAVPDDLDRDEALRSVVLSGPAQSAIIT